MIVEHGTLVVAADGGGAIVYRNAGHEGVAKLEVVETHDAKNKSFTREIGTDRPGRNSTPAGGKSAVAGPDYHDQAEREFAQRLATRLDELIGPHAHATAQPRIVLFASPRFLGMIRPDLTARVKAQLRVEIGKDLRQSTSHAIEHALAAFDHA